MNLLLAFSLVQERSQEEAKASGLLAAQLEPGLAENPK